MAQGISRHTRPLGADRDHGGAIALKMTAAAYAGMQMILHQHVTSFAERTISKRRQQRAEIGAGFKTCDIDICAQPRLQPRAYASRGSLDHVVRRHVVTNGLQKVVKIVAGHRAAPFFNSCCSFFRARCTVTATMICEIPIILAISGLV